MTIIFIDGFDDYILLNNKWNNVYSGVSIKQSVGKRDTNCLQIGSAYFDNRNCLKLDLNESSSTIVIGFAYKRPILKTPFLVDIARNKLINAANFVAGYPSIYAIDENRGSMWLGTSPTWIKVDLEDIRNICGFGLECHYGDTYSWSYYGSNNDMDWTLITSKPNTLFQGLVITSEIDVNYRYIRANIIPSSGSSVRVVSFQVYEYLNNIRDDKNTITVSFSNNGLKRCALEMGFNDITFNYNYDYNESSGIFRKMASWGDNSFNKYKNTTEDCFMYLESPNSVYNTTTLSLGCGGVLGRINRTQLKFDLNYLKDLKSITNPSLVIFRAKLYLYISYSSGIHTINVYRSLQNWTETQTTYNSYRTGFLWNQPGASAANPSADIDDGTSDRSYNIIASKTISGSYTGWISFDITSLANKWIDGSAKQYGVHIKSTNETIVNEYIYMTSSEGSDGTRPYLDIAYGTSCSGIKVSGCLVSGTWNYIESKIDFDNSSAEIHVNETPVLTVSGINTTENQINSMEIYSSAVSSNAADTHNYAYIDDLYLATTSGLFNNNFLGTCLVDVAYPSFSGTNNDYEIRYYYDDRRYGVINGPSYSYDYINEFTITSDVVDGYYTSFQSFITTSTNIRWEQPVGNTTGYCGKSFFRFKKINIPKGATILDARLLVTVYEASNTNYIYMDGRFERSGTPTTIPVSQADLESRELTSIESRASWAGAYSLSNGKSENLNNSLQELVDRPDWQEKDNIMTVIVSFGGYYGYESYIRLRSYEYSTVSLRPKLYIKWKMPLIYDMSEYLYSQTSGKDTYRYALSTSGIDLSSLTDIYAVNHNLKSSYTVNTTDYTLYCKPLLIVSGTEYSFDDINYINTAISGSYINNSVIINQNPKTSLPWTGEDLANVEIGSAIT